MSLLNENTLMIVVYLLIFISLVIFFLSVCSSQSFKETFTPQHIKMSETLLKNIPEVMERSRHYPTIEKFETAGESVDPPIRSYGTLLKNIPQVNSISKKFATTRPGKFKGVSIALPANFDGRVIWKDYLTPVSSQGSCGNCWAHATTSALADRFAIFSMGKIKFIPSPYEITVCAHKFTNIKEQWGNKKSLELMDDYLHGKKVDPTNVLQSAACEGASLFTAAEVLYTDGVPSIDCFPSSGRVGNISYDVSKTPSDNPAQLPYCHPLETMDFDTCIDQKTAAKKYRAKTAYNVGDPIKDSLDEMEQAIMYEIYKHGPSPTGFQVFSDFMEPYDGKTVYTHPDKYSVSNGGHAVKIVGWGNDGVDSLGNKNIPYWIIQNSWGTDWGEDGFFKIKRKIPECQTEQNAMGMLPDFPGMVISDPNIIPIETSTDIAVINAFKDHYLDPYTGYYLSGIEKIKECKLVGNVVPYIDPTISLPDYGIFYASQISEYLLKNPLKETQPLIPSVSCSKSSASGVSSSSPVVTPVTPPVAPSPVAPVVTPVTPIAPSPAVVTPIAPSPQSWISSLREKFTRMWKTKKIVVISCAVILVILIILIVIWIRSNTGSSTGNYVGKSYI